MHNFRRWRPSLQAAKSLELKHLRSAVAAADCGSFRQAAELLSSQQSSLSRRIIEIEHHLGIAIFERYSGGARPTRAGRSILRLARCGRIRRTYRNRARSSE
ncbi:helix-turn-helix domain-containing protein [Bradyrhizobium pachyrhizi]|uniref:helix-turn-helix domain-containing protein n=1 Tax=Bradyrhizobium pachyrhizi TaxID=280333 RepID=UPI003221EDB7